MTSLKSLVRALLPRRVRPHRILQGPIRGAWIVTSWHDYPAAIMGRTEPDLLEWFRQNVKPGETWLDVGAHYGYTAIALAKLVGSAGRVFAFEPSLSTAGFLDETRVLNGLDQIAVVPFALGEPGDIRMVSVSVDRGMANHAFGGSRSANIYVVSLDHFWTALGAPPIHGIKVDVQGMERGVVLGMLALLRKWQPKLIIEFHAGVDRISILSSLATVGYQSAGVCLGAGELHENRYEDDCSYLFLAKRVG